MCGLPMMYRTCSEEPMKGKPDGWAPIGNGSVHRLGPFLYLFSHSAPRLHTGALASVHRAEPLSSLQPLWWGPALPVRHTEFTSREMKQGQSFLVTKLSLHKRALRWESRAHKSWSSSQLCSTQTSWGCFLSPPCMFFKDAPNLLKSS